MPHEQKGVIPGYDPERDAGNCVFDAKAGQRPLDFFEQHLVFTSSEWAGQPFIADPWQDAIVRNFFGWKRPDGFRRYHTLFLLVPRKNGKTELTAAILCYIFFILTEAGGQIFSAAADREQAALVYDAVQAMIEANPKLIARCKIYKTFKSIQHNSVRQMYKVLPGDRKGKLGKNAMAYTMDELLEQQDRDLMDALDTSMANKEEPITIMMTTHDYARPSVCNEKVAYARGVRDGLIDDPGFLPVLYESVASEGEPADWWKNPQEWARVNPGYPKTPKAEYFERMCKKAETEPSFFNTFLRLHLNRQTEQDQRWLPLDDWQACGSLDADIHDGAVAYGGLDLSTIIDLSAFVLFFPECGNALRCSFWMPAESKLLRTGPNQTMYRNWISQGHIETTPGDVIDYSFIRSRIVEMAGRYDIRDVGYDPYNATQTALELREHDGIEMVEFRQGFLSMNEPSKEFEKLIISHTLPHGNNPVLTWMASNVAVQTDPAGNIKPVKPVRGSPQKIDGIVAAIMAMGRAIFAEQNAESVYEDRGILTL